MPRARIRAIRAVLPGVLFAGPLVGGSVAAVAPPVTVELESVWGLWSDAEITESSGLIWWRDRLITTNDSGSKAVLRVADRDGQATGTIRYAKHKPVDVEGLALGPDDSLWVGDIGDNSSVRETLSLYRLDNPELDGTVDSTRYEVRYPDGAHNAETLMVHPGTGDIVIATKSVFGAFYRIGPDLDPASVNTLERIPDATVPTLATDGVFSPDGTELYVRGYTHLAIYSYPDFRLLGSAGTPGQPQGEGLTNGPDGTLLASTEGRHSDIQQWRVHRAVGEDTTPTTAATPTSPADPSPAGASSPTTSAAGTDTAAAPSVEGDQPSSAATVTRWAWLAAPAAVVFGAGWLLARRRRG